MPEQIFGKNEAEIEETIREKLQAIAKEATEAATKWADGWRDDRVTVKRKVINALNERLERIIMDAISKEVVEKAHLIVRQQVTEMFTAEYIQNDKRLSAALKSAEAEFWRTYDYAMRDSARKAGDAACRVTSAQFEKSMTTLIKTSVLDHFAASDGLAELAEEEARRNG